MKDRSGILRANPDCSRRRAPARGTSRPGYVPSSRIDLQQGSAPPPALFHGLPRHLRALGLASVLDPPCTQMPLLWPTLRSADDVGAPPRPRGHPRDERASAQLARHGGIAGMASSDFVTNRCSIRRGLSTTGVGLLPFALTNRTCTGWQTEAPRAFRPHRVRRRGEPDQSVVTLGNNPLRPDQERCRDGNLRANVRLGLRMLDGAPTLHAP